MRALATPALLDSLERRLRVGYPDGADESIGGDERRARAQLIDLPAEDTGGPTDWHAAAGGAGGMPVIVLRDTSDGSARQHARDILTRLATDTADGIAAIVDRTELMRWGAFPNAEWVVAFRPGWIPGTAVRGEVRRAAQVSGMHGYLPTFPEMRATFIVQGPGIAAGRNLGIIDMRDVAPTLAARLGVRLSNAEGHNLVP